MDQQIQWSAPEFHYYEKGPIWYWALIGIATLLVIFALFQQNFFFAVFTIIAAILAGIWGARTPRDVTFTLSRKGLDISGRKFYPYDAFSGFSVIPDLPQSELFSEIILRGKGLTGAWTRIITPKDSFEEIHNMFAKSLPEFEHEESIAEHIARILRF